MTVSDAIGDDSSATTPEALEASYRELLQDLDSDPRELLGALERTRLTVDLQLATDLDRMELDHLRRAARDRRLRPVVIDPVGHALRAARERRLRDLENAPVDDPAALFDLIELWSEFEFAGEEPSASRCDQELERRIATVGEATERLRYEAGERFAALSTEEEDLDLPLRILRTERMRRACCDLFARTRHPMFRQLERRLARAWCDRTLQLRLERLLTRRGAAVLETTSLLLLFTVFGLLAIEASVGRMHWLMAVDASICTFFIAEFLFKLALAPARRSWFLRNVLTDLLPAIPAAAFFFTTLPSEAELTVLGRFLRLLRVFWIARYIQALRPILGVVRLVLFMVKGLDALVRRFSALLNRNFVFFERVVLPLQSEIGADLRSLAFRALRREHVLLADLPVEEAAPRLAARATALAERNRAAPAMTPAADPAARSSLASNGFTAPAAIHASERDIPVEHAIEYLWRIEPAELGAWLPRKDVLALDRLARIVNAPVVRSLPLIRKLRSPERGATAEERVIELGRRAALILEGWRERVLRVGDMQGILTGPQVLDRVATTLVNASKRPAIRLLLFGGLFTLVRGLVGAQSGIGLFLSKFVATPLVVLGSVCLVLLLLGRWLKSLAGEAAEAFKLTSEAHFIGLTELVKRRHQDDDLQFLAGRVFRHELDAWEGAAALQAHVRAARTGRIEGVFGTDERLGQEVYRVALLYLHFLDGAPLHENDVKTTEQLLANLSLENIRNTHLGYSKRQRKQLKKLAPGNSPLFGGPYVWFRFITESIAVETAKRVTDYNRNCLTLGQREVAESGERGAFAAWIRHRRDPELGRLERTEAPGGALVYRTTEFNALDFLTVDVQRDRHIERVFGKPVMSLLRLERRRIIREIFGTRPLHRLPPSRRTLNVYRFYQARLSNGRVFLLPLYGLGMVWMGVRMTWQKTAQTVREILAPEKAAKSHEYGSAPFAVALRKINRMKGPTLLEAMSTRVRFDPVYCGAPPSWTEDKGFDENPEFERDMDFLRMPERDREGMRRAAEQCRERVEELHRAVRRLSRPLHEHDDGRADSEVEQLRGERAVTIAWVTDRDDLRTLLRAERWFEDKLVEMESPDTMLPGYLPRRLLFWVCRGFRAHPVERWLRTRFGGRRISRRGLSNFLRAWYDGDEDLRRTVQVWNELPEGMAPALRGEQIARRIYATRDDIGRELAALRAVQSLSVLDVRNYRKLVFDLGGYAAEGEDPELAEALP